MYPVNSDTILNLKRNKQVRQAADKADHADSIANNAYKITDSINKVTERYKKIPRLPLAKHTLRAFLTDTTLRTEIGPADTGHTGTGQVKP